MKKYLKYSGICSLIFATIGFIFMMIFEGLSGKVLGLETTFPGMFLIFGGTRNYVEYVLAWPALIAWILALASIIILLLGIILPLLKVKVLQRFAGLLNLLVVAALLVAGVFTFISPSVFENANEIVSSASLTAGWIISGIFYILGGLIAALPAIADFTSKK